MTQTTLAIPSATASAPDLMHTLAPQPASQIDIQPEELRGVMLRFWHPWSGALGQAIERLVEEFNLSNSWGILATAVPYPGYDVLGSNLEASLQSSDAPQVAIGYLHQALTWDQGHSLVDLRPYVDDLQWGLSASEQADFYPLFWLQDVVDGRRLGIPAFRSGKLLLYNQTWAQELGFERPPADPDQFLGQACAAASANQRDNLPEKRGTGGWIISTDYAVMLGWIYAFGGEALKSPEPGLGQSVYQFNTPQIEQAFVFLRAAYENGCAWLPADDYSEDDFARRLGLFSTASVVDIPYQEDAFRSAGNQDQWTVLPFPSFSQRPAIDTYGPSYVLFSAAPQQQLAAWLFVRWLSSPEQHARLVQASGAFPVRQKTREHLETYARAHPQWAASLDLLSVARTEPPYKSWGRVRWALGDAATQLFRSYFTIDQTPVLLNYLDVFAAELHLGPDLESAFATSTSVPPPTARPTRTPAPSPSPTLTRTPRSPVLATVSASPAP